MRNMRLGLKAILFGALLLAGNSGYSQIAERERPKEWGGLVEGGRFMDRLLPMQGQVLSYETWGVEGVRPRYIDNGIEDDTWSYWGGAIMQDEEGKYRLIVCGWLENAPGGHAAWPQSLVFNTVSDNLWGPYVIVDTIGGGHNPKIFRTEDGQYVIPVIKSRYVANNINGPWERGRFEFNARDRLVRDGNSNRSYIRREDGSFLMIDQAGGTWISKTGLSEYGQVTDRSSYPPVEGDLEDPVVWRDHIQYHMVVNEWMGRRAYYLRSKDGVNWVADPGEAYAPGIAAHKGGQMEDWFKLEQMQVFQDGYGRAIQANFAVIDTLKPLDLANDIHSSKNITIPLNPGLLLTILDREPITPETKTIRVRIAAEDGFDPPFDIDVGSLRFGASAEVNFGRGSQAKSVEREGRDLIVIFDAAGNGITEEEFAPKMLGKTVSGEMIYGYARLPYVNYIEPIVSPRAPVFKKWNYSVLGKVEIQNFGQVASGKAFVKVEYFREGSLFLLGSGEIPSLDPFEKTEFLFTVNEQFETNREYRFKITLFSEGKELSVFETIKEAFL